MSTDITSRAAIREITQARLTFGEHNRVASTKRTLGFALDHAKAREAVLSDLDLPRLHTALETAGLPHQTVTSTAITRDTFVRRPDLGRQLPKEAHSQLAEHSPPDVAIVLGDGLSALAVALNGVAFIEALTKQLDTAGLTYGPIVIAQQARVALGDKIALALKAPSVVMALGERPGLSAADGLGIYITQNPQLDTPDSARNCLSNVRQDGLPIPEAARQTGDIVHAMRRYGQSGVMLNQHRAEIASLPNDATHQLE